MRKLARFYGIVTGLQESHMQPKLTPEEIQLLRQLNVRDRHALGGMARPAAADGQQALGYVVVHSPDSRTCFSASLQPGRAALATIEAET